MRHRGKQAHIDLQADLDGWARYAIRERAKVRLIIADRQTHAIANGLIAEGRFLYESWRLQLKSVQKPVDWTAGCKEDFGISWL